jgi:hypothetical protein
MTRAIPSAVIAIKRISTNKTATMDSFVYVVMKRTFIKNELGLELTFSSDYADFISFKNENDALGYVEQEIENITDTTDIPFVERAMSDIIGDNMEMWREWRQIGFAKKNGMKIGIVLFKQKIM